MNDDYDLWSEIKVGKVLTSGNRGEACVVLNIETNKAGTEWAYISIRDTFGYVLKDLVVFESNESYPIKDSVISIRRVQAREFGVKNKYSWKPKLTITDTSFIVGKLNAGAILYKPDDCEGSDPKFINASAVVIAGALKCKPSSYSTKNYIQVCYKGEIWLTEEDDIILSRSSFDELNSLSEDSKAVFAQSALKKDSLIRLSLYREFTITKQKGATQGLLLLKWGTYDKSEYTDGTNAFFDIYNPTKKTIKYIWFNVTGFNPVGDKVIDRKRNTSNIELKGVGPVEPGSIGKYTYDYVWFTDLVKQAKINSIKIQYMDGSFKLITDANQIVLKAGLYEALFSDSGM